ncbi:hypothetical protein R1sor_011528 [Riccia sorocarpa]|uniref:MULE transposase domain-containing protein n=1 Tax=Riccia sorocarpa TaxID=122646 RepID=A0ABD3I540_9MARC
MRVTVATENLPVPQIYQEEANRLSSSATASAMLPVLQSVDTSLYRARRTRFPPLPKSRAEIVIPESLHLTDSGENFVLLQLQNNDIIVFGTSSDFDVLCNATHVYMDGTFDSCPELYRQLFTLHALFEEQQVPLLYVLMSSKERVAYISLFRALKDHAVARGRQFSPQLILSDFESGLILAIRAEFLKSIIRESASMGRLLEYFQRQWFESIPTNMWNVHGIQRRTDNNCEGWHSKFNNIVDRHHPNIFHLIERLRSEQITSVRERLQIFFGQRVQRILPHYTNVNRALEEFRVRYTRGEIGILDFLARIGVQLR